MATTTQKDINKATYLLGRPNDIVGFNTPGGVPTPVYRCQAWALWAAHADGARFSVTSAIREDSVLSSFNRTHGTQHFGQQYLYDAFRNGSPGFYPANPPTRTSHCGWQDGSMFYPDMGVRLPRIKWGIDAVDDGASNDASKLVWHLNHVGAPAAKAYPGESSENHHIVLLCTPYQAWRALYRARRREHNVKWANDTARKRQV